LRISSWVGPMPLLQSVLQGNCAASAFSCR
jgi:hypothetical protein